MRLVMAWPAFWFRVEPWHLTYSYWATWACAILSVTSIIEYIWVNRLVLSQLAGPRSTTADTKAG